ncbi:MAG: hypothetical protein WC663_05605 [Patescibacteria group bacterium]|jgi:hypothetical protein
MPRDTGNPISEEEVSTDQESKEVRLGHAVEAYGGSSRELLATMLDQEEFKNDPRFGDLISELKTRLEQETTEARDPFDVEWIGKELVHLDPEKLAMLKKKEFRDYATELKTFTESGDVAKDDKGKLFLGLEEVARLTDVKEVSKRKDLFEGIKSYVQAENYSSPLSREAWEVKNRIYDKESLSRFGSRDIVKRVLRDAQKNNSELFLQLQRNLGGTQLLYGRHVSVNEARTVLEGLIASSAYHLSSDKVLLVSEDGNLEIQGDLFNEIKNRSQEMARDLLPVVNYYLACRPERHGMEERGTLSNLANYQERLKVTGLLQDKPFLDLYEEDGVVLSGLEGSEAINKMALETNRVGNEDYETMYKPMYEEQTRKASEAERSYFYKHNVFREDSRPGFYEDHGWMYLQQEWRSGQRKLSEAEMKAFLEDIMRRDYPLFPFLWHLTNEIRNQQAKIEEEVPTKVEEEQEILKSTDVKFFGKRMDGLKEEMEAYDKLASSWTIGKKEKLAEKWRGIKSDWLKTPLRYSYSQVKLRYEGIEEIDFSAYDHFFRDIDDLENFEQLREAASEFFNMNKLVETIAEGILEKRLKELEKNEADMKYLVKMYKVGYEKIMGYKQEGMEISEDKEKQIKIDPEVLARYGEE